MQSIRLIERFSFQILNRVSNLAALCLLALLLAACAAPQKQVAQEEEKEFVWPSPPSQPVIRWERLIFTSQEFETDAKKSSWKDILLGDEKADERFVYAQTPYGVHADKFGRVLVADPGAFGVLVFDYRLNRFLHPGGAGPHQFSGALGVSTDGQGNIYVTNSQNLRVEVFDQAGRFVRSIGGDDVFGRPVGIAVDDSRGRIYVSDTLKHHIAVFDLEGRPLETLGERGSEPGQFNFPLAMVLDRDGRLFVVDSMNFRIQILEPDGTPVSTISRQGDRVGELSRPRGVTLDSQGNVYVSDASFNNVQIFNQQGDHLMTFGQAGNQQGQFQFPSGMAFDAEDRLYVADQLNNRVQVFRFLGAPEIDNSESADSTP